ncbi:N-acyl homoserine lactonase family protein [Trinickia sp. NRRL B-1857]|uniref:N-acyl homoserine lactonase family protein n=1 Tax=Trinickia sp. NRRL B-1857 TaxID=3162879 RepID=UPI003D2C7B9E
MIQQPDSLAEPYEVFALRYARHDGRRSGENYLGEDPHGDASVGFDFYIWLIRNVHRTIVVDTGFTAEMAERRRRTYLRSPLHLLQTLDVNPATVSDVVITHMHYDHAGNIDGFPSARLHLQEAEMAYCTGRCMCHDVLRKPFEASDVAAAIGKLYAGQIRYCDNDQVIAPGVSVHLLGGHTAGLQVVRVLTARGYVVLASDAAHYWDNLRARRPFPIVLDVARMLEAHQRIEALADGPDHIVPGHDPGVRLRFPAWNGHEDIVQLHAEPAR